MCVCVCVCVFVHVHVHRYLWDSDDVRVSVEVILCVFLIECVCLSRLSFCESIQSCFQLTVCQSLCAELLCLLFSVFVCVCRLVCSV